MSKKHDAMRQIRVTPENWKWMQDYRKLLGAPVSMKLIGNMLLEKGRDRMPMMQNGGK